MLQTDERKARGEHQSISRKIHEIKAVIQAEENRLAERSGGSTATLADNIEKHKQQIESLRADMHALEAQNANDKAELENAEIHASNISRQESSKQEEIREAEARLRNVSRAGKDPLQGFQPSMRELLRLIDNERGFSEKPIGPLGIYITLKEPKWESIIEKFFGGTLSSFVVSNYEDGRILSSLMDRARCRVPYSVLKSKQFTLDQPNDQYLTVLKVLDIENEVVRTQLIVAHGAEQTILIEDLRFASDLMRDRRQQDNIQQCFSINRNRPGYGHRVGGAIGVSSVAPVQPYKGITRMKSGSITRQIEEMEKHC